MSLPSRRAVFRPLLQLPAEAAWITVVAAALTTVAARHEPRPGLLLEVLALCLAGLLISWAPMPLGVRRWILFGSVVVALPVALTVNADGLGLSAAAWWEALKADPAVVLAPLAVLRGAGVTREPIREAPVEGFLAWGAAVVAFAWIVGGWASPDLTRLFQIHALVPTVLFATCAVAAVAVSRLDALRVEGGGQARGGWWRALVVGLAVATGIASLGALVLLGVPVGEALLVAWRPIAIALVYLVWPFAVAMAWLVALLRSLMGAGELERPDFTPLDPASGFGEAESGLRLLLFNVAALVALLVVLVLLFVLVSRWLRPRSEVDEPGEVEERETVRPVRPPVTPPSIRREPQLSGAAGAYLAALRELAARGSPWARRPAETPRQHAHRLRSTPISQLPWLAADYQLAQYAAARLSKREEDKATRRLARLRSVLRT